MNDFTKEELGIIACNLCVNPKTKGILRKLALMIDNYCEHDCKHESDGNIFCSNPPQNKCKLCGEFYR